MGGLLDKVLLAGLGLEHKAREKMDELAAEGETEIEEGLDMKEEMENKLVENIVEVMGGALRKVGVAKKEVDAVVASLAEDVTERMKIVTLDDLDVVEKLVMKNREKISALEKKIRRLEETVETLTQQKSKG